MNSEKVKITFRVTKEEKLTIQRKAKQDQKSVNLYLRDRALAFSPQALDGRLRTDMMRELCSLQNIFQANYLLHNWEKLYTDIARWRAGVLVRLENP